MRKVLHTALAIVVTPVLVVAMAGLSASLILGMFALIGALVGAVAGGAARMFCFISGVC